MYQSFDRMYAIAGKKTELFLCVCVCSVQRMREENVETSDKNCSFLPFDWFRILSILILSLGIAAGYFVKLILRTTKQFISFMLLLFFALVLLLRVHVILFVCASNRLYIIANCSIKTRKEEEEEEPITRSITTKTKREKMKSSRIQKWSTMRYGWVPMLNNNIQPLRERI